MVIKHKITKPFLSFAGRLSEGPTYNPSNNTLYWVDIIGSKFHSIKLLTESPDEYSTKDIENITKTHKEYEIKGAGESCGVIYLTNNKDILYLGLKNGIAKYDLNKQSYDYVFSFNEPKLRSNDGNVDPTGKYIYQGLMGDFAYGPIQGGKLIKIDIKTGESNKVFDSLIPNGLNWLGDSMYWTSSLDHKIYKFDYKNGEPSNKITFADLKKDFPDYESPEPDGHSLTETGDLYTAVWGTNSVAHYDPNGELVELFQFPCNRISAVGFAGPDLDEMIVTTGDLYLDDVAKWESKQGLKEGDLGGCLFRVKLKGVKGVMRTKLII